MKTLNSELAVATAKWQKLNHAYGLVTQLADELPPEVNQQLDPWIQAMESLQAAAESHHAVLAPAECDMMGRWLTRICNGALDEHARAPAQEEAHA